MDEWIGIDIGGTKLAVVRGTTEGRILEKERLQTAQFGGWQEALGAVGEIAGRMKNGKTLAAGISCGGPLDSRQGMILSPPNLPGWDEVPIVQILSEILSLPVYLQNDADACALAEWKYGAGKGYENLIFCTFGTGMGAGLILDNKLYTGRNGSAGEAGHMRLNDFGPAGYGKEGSFEGFCSGGGMAQLGRMMAYAAMQRGETVEFCRNKEELNNISAERLGKAAEHGDKTALKVFAHTGRKLGEGLAVMMDILNPDCIIIGSIFARCEKLLRPEMERAIQSEALETNYCPVKAAALGENLGDAAAISVAVNGFSRDNVFAGNA